MIMLTIAPIFPTAIEATAKIIPITDSIRVIVQAHLLPFHKPYAITKYAIPNSKDMIPVAADSPLNSDTKGEATSHAIPVARNTVPPIAVSIAIIVTPKGRCF